MGNWFSQYTLNPAEVFSAYKNPKEVGPGMLLGNPAAVADQQNNYNDDQSYEAKKAALDATNATYAAQGLVNPNDGDANNIAASLVRSQYANWEKNFKPIELQALQQSSLNNPNVLSDAVDEATVRATSLSDNLAGVERRQLSGLGVAPTEQQSAVSSRVRNLNRAGIMASAQNNARSNVAATDEMIALGGIPSVAV